MELWQQLLSDNLTVAAEAIEKFVNNQNVITTPSTTS